MRNLSLSQPAGLLLVSAMMVFMILLLSVITLADAHDYSNSPVRGRMSSGFGWRDDPYTGNPRFHAGIDIAAEEGTPIYAPQDGTVVYSGRYKGYGNVVVLQHQSDLHTLYGHTQQLLVHQGQWVQRGHVIALVGSTGRSTGPHLHFEVRQNKGFVNPLHYLAYLEQANLPTVAHHTPQPVQRIPYSSQPGYSLRSVGGPEIPVAYRVQSYTASSQTNTTAFRQGSHQGNAIWIQPRRQGRSGHSIQVITGNKVQTVQF